MFRPPQRPDHLRPTTTQPRSSPAARHLIAQPDRLRLGAINALVLLVLFGLLWSALPYDSPGKVFQTLIAWDRYAGLMDFNASTGRVFVPKVDDDDAAEGRNTIKLIAVAAMLDWGYRVIWH